MKFHENPSRRISTAPFITGTSTNFRWRPAGFPSISLFLSTFFLAVDITSPGFPTPWCRPLLLSDGKSMTYEVQGFCVAIGILRSAVPLPQFRGARKHGTALTTWVFGAILCGVTGELCRTLTGASAWGALT